MGTAIQNAYKDATLTFTDDKITWHCPVTNDTREVMMDWEQPIMAKMAEVTVSEGDHVLECGFGMGILSDAIQARNPASHTICEFHPQVLEKAKAWAADKPNVTIHEDKWITLLDVPGRYNAILMDTYADDDLHYSFAWFCGNKALENCKITWWNFSGGETDEYMKFYWDDVTFTDVTVDPPLNSYYNKDIYKVPLKILSPNSTSYGIVNESTSDSEGAKVHTIVQNEDNSVSNVEREIDMMSSGRKILTCENPSSPDLVYKDTATVFSMKCKGVYEINDGLITATGNYPMIVKRNGSWINNYMNEVVVGDKLYKKDNTEVEVTKIEFNGDSKKTIVKINVNGNYFVNDILVKGGTDG